MLTVGKGLVAKVMTKHDAAVGECLRDSVRRERSSAVTRESSDTCENELDYSCKKMITKDLCRYLLHSGQHTTE